MLPQTRMVDQIQTYTSYAYTQKAPTRKPEPGGQKKPIAPGKLVRCLEAQRIGHSRVEDAGYLTCLSLDLTRERVETNVASATAAQTHGDEHA